MNFKTQLKTLIALDQFWNVLMNNILAHCFFSGPDQRAMDSRETFPVNSVSFLMRPPGKFAVSVQSNHTVSHLTAVSDISESCF